MDKSNYRSVEWSEIVYYDPTSITGLRWKISPSYKVKIGNEVGYLKDSERWRFSYKGKQYYNAIVVWSLFFQLNDDNVIDHIDQNALNNIISNLREIPFEKNMRNTKKRLSNKSGETGVSTRINYGTKYYVVEWYDSKSKRQITTFNCSKLGEENAKLIAIYTRKLIIETLTEEGLGYTLNHGK